MGTVHKCRLQGSGFDRIVAVKTLHAHLAEDETFRAMFLEEARLAGGIRHPNVVSVLDVREHGGTLALVMDYIQGVTVGELVQWHVREGYEVPYQLCLSIVRDTAKALEAAHSLCDAEGQPLGLIHRDVSPQNVLLDANGVAYLTDFGIAKAYDRQVRTRTGVIKGKYGYLAPEVLQYREPDHRADLFSLGVVLFELLAGRNLYPAAEGLESARRVIEEPVPDILDERDDVDPRIVDLLFRLLAKDRDDRPAQASHVVEILTECLDDALLDETRFDPSPLVSRILALRHPPDIAEEAVTRRDGKSRRAGRWVALATGLGAVSVGLVYWLNVVVPSQGKESVPPVMEIASDDEGESPSATPSDETGVARERRAVGSRRNSAKRTPKRSPRPVPGPSFPVWRSD